jgi:hypothetical protein
MGASVGVSFLHAVRVLVGYLLLAAGCLLTVAGSALFIDSLYERWVISVLAGEGAISATGQVIAVSPDGHHVTYSFDPDGPSIEGTIRLPDVSDIDIGAPVTLRYLTDAPSICRPSLVYPVSAPPDPLASMPRTRFVIVLMSVLLVSTVPGLLFTTLAWPLIRHVRTPPPCGPRSNLNIRGMMLSGFEIGLVPFPLFATFSLWFARLAFHEILPLLIVCAGIVIVAALLFWTTERLKKRFGQRAVGPEPLPEAEVLPQGSQ